MYSNRRLIVRGSPGYTGTASLSRPTRRDAPSGREYRYRSYYLLKRQQHKNFALPLGERLQGLSDHGPRPVDRGVADLERLRAHRVAGCRAADEEIPSHDRTKARIHLHLHAPAVSHLDLVVTALAQQNTWLLGHDARNANVVGAITRLHPIRLRGIDHDQHPRGDLRNRRDPLGHVLILGPDVPIDPNVARDVELVRRARRTDPHIPAV